MCVCASKVAVAAVVVWWLQCRCSWSRALYNETTHTKRQRLSQLNRASFNDSHDAVVLRQWYDRQTYHPHSTDDAVFCCCSRSKHHLCQTLPAASSFRSAERPSSVPQWLRPACLAVAVQLSFWQFSNWLSTTIWLLHISLDGRHLCYETYKWTCRTSQVAFNNKKMAYLIDVF